MRDLSAIACFNYTQQRGRYLTLSTTYVGTTTSAPYREFALVAPRGGLATWPPITVGLLFWWNAIDPAPLRSRLGYPVQMLYFPPIIATRVVVAAFLTFATQPLYAAYVEARPILPVSLLEDQQAGALLMWEPGAMMHLIAIGLIFAVWTRKSEEQRSAEDRIRLAEAHTAARGPAPPPGINVTPGGDGVGALTAFGRTAAAIVAFVQKTRRWLAHSRGTSPLMWTAYMRAPRAWVGGPSRWRSAATFY